MQPVYKRILLKLSGEALAGEQGFGLNQEVIAGVVDEIVKVHAMGVEIGVVIGGGNFWRGRQGTKMDRSTADQMGMLATVMNSLAMMDAIEQRGVPVRVQTALNMISIAEPLVNQGLKVIDSTAATMCMENGVPTLAFGLNEKDSILRAVCGEKIGTLISAE